MYTGEERRLQGGTEEDLKALILKATIQLEYLKQEMQDLKSIIGGTREEKDAINTRLVADEYRLAQLEKVAEQQRVWNDRAGWFMISGILVVVAAILMQSYVQQQSITVNRAAIDKLLK